MKNTNSQNLMPLGRKLLGNAHSTERSREQIIQESHARCRAMGIDPTQTSASDDKSLSPAQLKKRIQDSQPYYDIVTKHMSTLYAILKGSGFCMAIADAEGYLIHTLGDPQLLAYYESTNCVPGTLWSEENAGTCALGLALREGVPIQLCGDEMYCKRHNRITNSATPVYDNHGTLIGAIALSGFASGVHIHTLGMAILTAKAIRSQLGELEKVREAAIRNTYMTALMESEQRGVLALNATGDIVQINNKARALLGIEENYATGAVLEKKDNTDLLNIADLTRTSVNWKNTLHSKSGFSEREVTFLRGDSRFPLVCTLDPITMPDGESAGGMLLIMEHNRVIQLVNEMAGSQARFTFDSIIGNSSTLNAAKKVASTAARGNAAVLLHGETGTGKELFAQAIHNASPRKGKPFVVINCGAIPNELLESELFGYVEGAFTGARKGGRPGKFELADGGTLFLDEIGDMPIDMQVKILRALQSGEVHRVGDMQPTAVDLRVISATNVNLDTAIEQGGFREDLFYRISTLNITIPPLRERGTDVLQLARTFLKRIRPHLGKPELDFSPSALKALSNAHWPGNIRQLENAVERAVNISEGDAILPQDLGLTLADSKFSHPASVEEKQATSSVFTTQALPDDIANVSTGSDALLGEMEQALIERLMVENTNNISKVSKKLGVSRPTLYRKLKKYGLSH